MLLIYLNGFWEKGKVPAFLLLCTIVPIVKKDNIGDITSSDNYRAIAIGSLILKWFDWLIIILEEENLNNDELQFGFQANSSTSLCTWGIVSVVDYYNRAGRPVFACSMDLSKAFDLVACRKSYFQSYWKEIYHLCSLDVRFIFTQIRSAMLDGETIYLEPFLLLTEYDKELQCHLLYYSVFI